jgi:hypothetical protein
VGLDVRSSARHFRPDRDYRRVRFLGGQRDVCAAHDKVLSAIAPGGYLLYGDYLGDQDSRRIHASWWGRWLLLRPPEILPLVAAHPALVEVARRETAMHLLALFQNRQ